ncbi:MAG: amidohydrolase [Sulfolobaceae archaeon]|nr:amidohydrolase [Sulfolobaceae archaeon]
MAVQNKTYTLVKCRAVADIEKISENINITIDDNGRIKSIGSEIEGDEIDCRNYVVIPGLINAHTHSAMIALRGYYDDAELQEWLRKMWEFERSMSKDLMRISSEIAIIEMLSSGTTGFVDMYFNPEQLKELSNIYKIRVQAGYTFLDNLYDPYLIDKLQRELKPEGYFQPIINVHSIYATSKETLELANQLSKELGERIHIHVSETRREIYEVKKKTGMFPVEYLNSLNMLDRMQLVHLGWVASWEIDLIREKNAIVTNCPTSAMKLATAGFFPFKEMLNSGITVTLGTDGPASNNSLDMFREMKNAILLYRHSYWSTSVKAIDAFRSATYEGYKLLKVKGGKIREGYVADLVLLDAKRLYPLFKDRLISHIVYTATGDMVKAVIVNGNMRTKDEILERLPKLIERLHRLLNA